MIRDIQSFLGRAFVLSFSGGWMFYSWMASLTLVAAIGAHFFFRQLADGLGTTGMTDQVSWGVYIANFTFLVGLAAAAVMIVIPAYIYRNKDMYEVVLFGELLAIAAMIMCLLFVLVDLGRPDRMWHLMPIVGEFNFPVSMLAWDVVVLNGYLALNMFICSYLLYTKYMGRTPNALLYVPFVIVSIVWAISTHTVTAFLYVGLAGRPFWNSAIVAPRFLGSAFTAGPGLLIIAFQVIRMVSDYRISDSALHFLRNIVTASLLINLFLLACEAFKEFYASTAHSASATYLFLGLEHNGHTYNSLVPWVWTAIGIEIVAVIILVIPTVARQLKYLNLACVLAIVGIWIEKGMGLVIPGFVPSPQGSIVEYAPTWSETIISLGIWAFGLLIFSWMLHIAIPILGGHFHAPHIVPDDIPEDPALVTSET